jgi:GntR family transcriptional regulator
MFFRIAPGNGLAIYDQIARQIKFAVASETLGPRQMVPSVRELARELAVNPNTVARAYRDLQAEGVLVPVRGKGLQVTDHAAELCQKERLRLVRERVAEVLREARRSGLTEKELRRLVDEEFRESRAAAQTDVASNVASNAASEGENR